MKKENEKVTDTVRILFTGVGRRIELLQAFRNAAHVLGKELRIYGADMDETAPALSFCDEIRLICPIRNSEYVPQLLRICEQDRIDLLIPTIDTDLFILSQNMGRFQTIGTKVLVSPTNMIKICRDKDLTASFFEECGLYTPKTYNDCRQYEGSYPCFIKPKDGSSSINAFRVEKEAGLYVYAELIGDYIIQDLIEGEEYTVDIFCDFLGKPIYITPRKRLAVRSGEVLKTQIWQDAIIIEECQNIIKKFKPCGPITVQLIREQKSGKDYYIEINPRYGGGAPLSIKAGADSPQMLLKLLSGEKVEYQKNAARDGEIYCRFDQSIRVNV